MAFLADEPPVICDWLPWNHTFGGNHNVGLVLYNGGTLYIDDGKPTPDGMDATIRNLREIAPTAYFNVPRGYEMLMPYLKADAAFRRHFFSRVQAAVLRRGGSGAALLGRVARRGHRRVRRRDPDDDRARRHRKRAVRALHRIRWRGLGPDRPARAGRRGSSSRRSARRSRRGCAGPTSRPGSSAQPDLTAAAFDEEGFYKLGDAVRWVDDGDPGQGLVFDGRINEDFKLSTGTWVSVGPLRAKFLQHFGGLAQDVVIAAPDRAFVAALVFPAVDACAALAPDLPAGATAEQVVSHPTVRARISTLLDDFARQQTGSATTVARLILLDHATLARRARDHRQRVAQPEGRPRQPRGARGRPLRGPAAAPRHRVRRQGPPRNAMTTAVPYRHRGADRLRRARPPGARRRAVRHRRAGHAVLQRRRLARSGRAGGVLPVAQDGVRRLHRGGEADRPAASLERGGCRLRRQERRHRAGLRQPEPAPRRRCRQ